MTANFEGFSHQPELNEVERDLEYYAHLYPVERPMAGAALREVPSPDGKSGNVTALRDECLDDLLDDPRFGLRRAS